MTGGTGTRAALAAAMLALAGCQAVEGPGAAPPAGPAAPVAAPRPPERAAAVPAPAPAVRDPAPAAGALVPPPAPPAVTGAAPGAGPGRGLTLCADGVLRASCPGAT